MPPPYLPLRGEEKNLCRNTQPAPIISGDMWPYMKNILFLYKKNSYADKRKNKKTIDTLPDNFTIEDVIEELIILDKIEQGLNDVKDGNVYTTDEAKKIMKTKN
jgi:hypothetical protein